MVADVHAKRKDYQSQVQDLDAYLKLAPSSAASADVRKVRDTAKRLGSQSAPVSSPTDGKPYGFADWLEPDAV